MSKYTTEVRFICETAAGLTESQGFTNLDALLEQAAPEVFNFDWPIYDEDYRLPLEVKILRFFYTREISEETVGLWKLRLQNRLCQIMPYYNQLYESAIYDFDPYNDVDVTRIMNYGSKVTVDKDTTDTTTYGSKIVEDTTTTNDTTYNTTITDTGNSQDLYSDTPQGGLNGISSNTYLTNARIKSDSNTNKKTGIDSNTGTDDTTTTKSGSDIVIGTDDTTTDKTGSDTETIKGKRGGQAYIELLMKLRESFINIDRMILNDLEPLFFGLWE